MNRDPASFRDPGGHVYHDGQRVLRTIGPTAAGHYEAVRKTGALQAWIDRGWLVNTKEIAAPAVPDFDVRSAVYVLEHERVPFISHPYEWSFSLLKQAALLHLDLALDAFGRGLQMADATAYNVQFVGVRPVFIDVLSFRPYVDGDYWVGHRQFCDQFLNPLLLRALAGVPHNGWLRGSPEGIPTVELDALLPIASRLSWNVFSHVSLPAKLARKRAAAPMHSPGAARRLPKAAYKGLLTQLRTWIAGLAPRNAAAGVWRHYEAMKTYSAEEKQRKQECIRGFVAANRPPMLWDLGCNTGEFSETALGAGADYVLGFDADHEALDAAHARAERGDLRFLPLFLDAANPTPDQGWNQRERRGLAGRGRADAVLALALVHHLAIGRNVPLPSVLAWLTGLAPRGVVEFVPKHDPAVQRMLASREDVFADYDAGNFEAALASHARVLRAETISGAGRRLYIFERP